MVFTPKQLIPYITTKLAGAGFLLCVMFTYLFLASGFDLYKFVEGISNGMLWLVVFGYGILCSLLIDLLAVKIPKGKYFLYIVSGYAVFIINGLNVYTLIAGTVGALSSLIFYFGTYLSFRLKTFTYFFSIFVPLFFIILMNVDFTEKKQWHEVKDGSSYTATFEQFNGKHEIPIQAKAGQTIISIIFSYDFINKNGGGHGFHILDEKNNLVGMNEINEQESQFKIKDDGIYRMVVTGDDVKGKFSLTWRIEDSTP